MQRHASPSKSQQAAISAAGLNPLVWTVIKEWSKQLLIRNRLSGAVRVINK